MWLQLLACDPIDLSEEWDLDRLRLLAVKAEPAEPRPGDTVRFSSLSYVPFGQTAGSLWFACVDGGRRGCVDDPEALAEVDPRTLTGDALLQLVQDLQEQGLIGYEPGSPPVWETPIDAMADVPDNQLNEGVSATVQIALATEEDIELVVRRIPVSIARTPNNNPVIQEVTADGEPLAEPFLIVERGKSVGFTAAVAGGPENYDYITTEGWLERRKEKFEWRWYTDIGKLDGGGPIDFPGPEPSKDVGTARWTAPRKPGQGLLYAVVLDGRGGMGWSSVLIRVD